MALNFSNTATGGQQRVRIRIDRWSTQKQREDLIKAFQDKQSAGPLKAQEALLKALEKQKDVGRFNFPGYTGPDPNNNLRLGTPVKYAMSFPLDGGGRRSLYLEVRRNFLPPMMLAFDAPIPFTTVGERSSSNVPAQALILMNDPFVIGEAGRWAARLLADGDRPPRERIAAMFLSALGRPPLESEVADWLAFLDRQGEAYGLAPAERLASTRTWTDLCHVVFNLKEFIFIE